MIERQKGAIKWLEFELLAGLPLIHGCFDRHGGVSEKPYDTLNVGSTCGDDPGHVDQNRQIVMDTLGLVEGVFARAHHRDLVIAIDSLDLNDLPSADGITTKVDGLALLVTQADCQTAIFYDPIERVLGNVHCGWRGNVQDIYGKTVEHLKTQYGCKSENILVCIGPSLGPESSEFVNWKTEFPPFFAEYQFKPNYFDLWAIAQAQLQHAGILPHHIEIAAIDTYKHSNYFSYRREKQTGRQVTVCAMRPKELLK